MTIHDDRIHGIVCRRTVRFPDKGDLVGHPRLRHTDSLMPREGRGQLLCTVYTVEVPELAEVTDPVRIATEPVLKHILTQIAPSCVFHLHSLKFTARMGGDSQWMPVAIEVVGCRGHET